MNKVIPININNETIYICNTFTYVIGTTKMWKAKTLMFDNTFVNAKQNYYVKVIDFY